MHKRMLSVACRFNITAQEGPRAEVSEAWQQKHKLRLQRKEANFLVVR